MWWCLRLSLSFLDVFFFRALEVKDGSLINTVQTSVLSATNKVSSRLSSLLVFDFTDSFSLT